MKCCTREWSAHQTFYKITIKSKIIFLLQKRKNEEKIKDEAPAKKSRGRPPKNAKEATKTAPKKQLQPKKKAAKPASSDDDTADEDNLSGSENESGDD